MSSYTKSVLHCLEGAAALAIVLAASSVHAQAVAEQIQIDLPAQSMGESLKALGLALSRNISADTSVVGDRQAPEVHGAYSAAEALDLLLRGTGLGYRRVGDTLVVEIMPAKDRTGNSSSNEILVTGSRIRGAQVTSLVISSTRASIEASGITTMADAVRSIPQSFGGGANPGIGFNVPSSSGADVGGTSTVNLRGLGSDATLTLINGHRAAYNGSRQGIDISAIPLGIVDKIEVVPDGASALYGSDAVAGVVNVILRRDFDGAQVRADIGGATEGGGFRQQYGLVAGKRWISGGFVAAYEYQSIGSILSDERHYTSSNPGVTLFPEQKRHAVVVNGHQDITERLSFSLDALFNRRQNFSVNANNTAGDLGVSRTERPTTSRSLVIAPSLNLDLSGAWQATLSGVYGSERLRITADSYMGDTRTSAASLCYCNELRSVELNVDGPVFALPGGLARVAAGAGYRDNLFKASQLNAANAAASQDSYYAYGEVNLPVLSAEQHIPGIDHLNLSGAIRYERYPGIGSVATPKLGLLYAPFADLAIKGSWGRSFRAPTMYQLHQVQIATAYNAPSLGGTNGTALYLTGGNARLQPERARTWSAALDYKPHQLPGLWLQVSYFAVRYSDRIVTPLVYPSQALRNPVYADYVTTSPGQGAVIAAVADAGIFYNNTGRTYEPGNVTAIVNNANVNAGRQTIHGVDALVQYDADFADAGKLSVALNGSYLQSHQRLTAEADETRLAGSVFNPPHWRGRGSVTWSKDGVQLNATLSRYGGVSDVRYIPTQKVEGMTVVDATASYAFGAAGGLLSGLSITLTAQNLFNAAPDRIAAPNYYDTPYDTTNYSPAGRFLGAGIVKSW